MSSKTRVALIFGGVSTEHEVSIVSAASIARSLDPERYEAVYVAIDKTGAWFLGPGAFETLKSGTPAQVERVILSTDPKRRGFLHLDSGELTPVDVIFPVLHGPRGEDGTIQGMFEMAGIAYVGCDPLSAAIAMDKDMTKRVLAQRGIAVVKGTCLNAWMWKVSSDEVLHEILNTLGFPLFVKPATLGSSVGISRATHEAGLKQAIETALGFSRKVIVEKAVQGALEIEVAVLGNNEPRASVPGQIIPAGEFYDYAAKYIESSTDLVIPARIGRALAESIQFIALDAYDALGCTGLARVDFLVSDENCYVNELNTLPGFTSISMYPKLWAATGVPYPLLITLLIDLALQRHAAQDGLTRTITLERGLGL